MNDCTIMEYDQKEISDSKDQIIKQEQLSWFSTHN